MSTLPDIARWQRVKDILGQALDLPAPARDAFMRSQAADTAELRHLRALQAAGDGGHALLDGGREQLFAQHAGQAEPERFGADWSGRIVGRYRLLALIARGGMGQVYRAVPLHPAGTADAARAAGADAAAPPGTVPPPPEVAVKLVREGWIGDAMQRRFESERRILERLDHPNLARLLDGGFHGNTPYLVMELVDGEPIDAHCRQHAPDVPAVLRLFLTLCDVVHYAHVQGVVHRDLKPANVLVTREGQVKLLDFGIAKQLDGFTPTGESTATVTALRVMTLACASPEQVRGLAVTPASDVYSLGVLLYRLLTGQLPYRLGGEGRAGSDFDLRNAICNARPLPPSQVLKGQPDRRRALRGDLDAVVLKALRKDPARRHASVAVLADELRRHLERRPRPGAEPCIARLGAALRPARLHRGRWLAGALVLAAGAGVGAQAWRQAHAEAAQAEREWAGLQARLQQAAEEPLGTRPLAELAPARVQLQQALQALDRWHGHTPPDATAGGRLAQAYARAGQAQAGHDGLGLDEPALAERSLRRALALFGPAVVATADATRSAALRRDWAAAQATLARLLLLQGRRDEAQALAREALANARQAAAQEAGLPGIERALALSELALARALDAQRDGDELQDLLRSAAPRLESLQQRHPADVALLLARAEVRRQQGLYLLRADVDPQPGARHAAQALRQAVALLRPAADGPPPRPAAQLALALAQADLAQALRQVGPDTARRTSAGGTGEASALDTATQARDALQALWRSAPQQHALRWHLADVAGTLGRLQLAAGAFDAAVQTAEETVATLAPPDAAAGDDPAGRLRQGWAWYQLGRALIARASTADAGPGAAVHEPPPPDWLRACDSYRRSLALLEPPPADAPGQARPPDAARLIEMRQVLRTCPAT